MTAATGRWLSALLTKRPSKAAAWVFAIVLNHQKRQRRRKSKKVNFFETYIVIYAYIDIGITTRPPYFLGLLAEVAWKPLTKESLMIRFAIPRVAHCGEGCRL